MFQTIIMTCAHSSVQGFNESAGVLVFTVSAQDADIGTNGQITYSLTGSLVQFFTIDPSTGVIRVGSNGVDFEALGGNPLVTLTVTATDQGGWNRLCACVRVWVHVCVGGGQCGHVACMYYYVCVCVWGCVHVCVFIACKTNM